MSNYTTVAYMINAYLLSKGDFRAAIEWDGTGIYPIYPGQEPRDTEQPFLTYRERRTKDGQMWWLETSDITYRIVAPTVKQAETIVRIMMNYLDRMDEVADEINVWEQQVGGTNWDVNYVRMISSFSPEPAETEGGVRPTVVIFRVGYMPAEVRPTQYA